MNPWSFIGPVAVSAYPQDLWRLEIFRPFTGGSVTISSPSSPSVVLMLFLNIKSFLISVPFKLHVDIICVAPALIQMMYHPIS